MPKAEMSLGAYVCKSNATITSPTKNIGLPVAATDADSDSTTSGFPEKISPLSL